MPGTDRGNRQRGSMLIVAMGVLTLMSLMAVTFGLLMTLERKAATAYVDRVRSQVLTQAGMESVIGEIKSYEAYRVYSDPDSPMKFNPDRKRNSDFSVKLQDVAPEKTSHSRELGTPRYGPDGVDRFRVKRIDANAMININDHHPTLSIMFEALGDIVAQVRDIKNPLKSGMGIRIFGNPRDQTNPGLRDRVYGGKFESKEQLKEILGERGYRLIRDYVTTHSWVDTTAVMPSRDTISNPSTAIARGKVQWVRPENAAPVQFDLLQLGGRAPINVNEAPLEVLAAAIMPLGGRRAYHPIPNQPAPLPLDSNVTQTGGPRGLLNLLEEMDFSSLYWRKGQGLQGQGAQWQPYQWVFFPPYWKQANGVDRAIALAQAIVRERNGETHAPGRHKGPFQSVMDFERWVDSLPNNETYFCSTREAVIPTEAKLPLYGPIRSHPDYSRFHFESVKSIIKANFNPNALVNSFNPSSAAWRPLDKSSLVYPTDEQLMKVDTTLGQSISVGDFFQCQSVDFCYGPMGVYEITSVGEVAGDEDPNLPPGKNRPVYGMWKQRAVVKLMGVIRHTTQRDFEKNDNLYNNGNRKRTFMRSYPENDIFWAPGDGTGRSSAGHGVGACREYGRLELDTALSRSTQPRDKSNLVLGGGSSVPPRPLFELKMDKRDPEASAGPYRLHDSFRADRGGGQNNPQAPLAQPYGTVVYGDHDTKQRGQRTTANFVLQGGALMPDGVRSSLSTEGKGTTGDPRTLWYRVADNSPLDPAAQGLSAPEGEVNLPPYEGTVEFWYKPDFDWAFWDENNRSPGEPNPIFCGLLQTTHVMNNPGAIAYSYDNADNLPTRVIQMFVFRNTSGDIRIVRLYSELLGRERPNDDEERPLLMDPYADDGIIEPLTVRRYIELREDPLVKAFYPWPPKDRDGNVQIDILQYTSEWNKEPKVTYARQDYVIPFDDLRFWRAHEWHHISISWDDLGGTGKKVPDDFIKIFVDGRWVDIGQKVNFWVRGERYSGGGSPDKAGEFVRLNHYPDATNTSADLADKIAKDSMFIGCIHRKQLVPGGVFKFDDVVTFGSNGTVDDVRTYQESIQSGVEVARPTDRFVRGVYEQRFEIPFPGNVDRIRLGTLSFTAYMPQEHDDADPNKVTGARVEVSVLKGERPLEGFGGGGWVFNEKRPAGGFSLTDNLEPTGKPIYLEKGETLRYRVVMVPGRNSLGQVATPVLDDVTLTYFLPKVAVLYQEEVLD